MADSALSRGLHRRLQPHAKSAEKRPRRRRLGRAETSRVTIKNQDPASGSARAGDWGAWAIFGIARSGCGAGNSRAAPRVGARKNSAADAARAGGLAVTHLAAGAAVRAIGQGIDARARTAAEARVAGRAAAAVHARARAVGHARADLAARAAVVHVALGVDAGIRTANER